MDIVTRPFVDSHNSALMTKSTLRVLSSYITYQDFVLLPFILLASTIVYNRGSVLPKRDPYVYKLFERPQALLNSQTASRTSTRNVAEKIEATNADLVIFWGSQSGVAEGFAERLACEFTHRFKKAALVADLSDFDPQTVALIPQTKLAIFIMSTYGEGEPSDNALEFVAWVNSKLEGSLDNLRYGAFGCGNCNYRYYNKTIDDLDTGLASRGATAVMPTGKGDESTRATEEDFLEWKRSFFSVLVSQFNFTEYDVEYKPRVEVVEESPEGINQPLEVYAPFVRGAKKQGLSEIVSVPIATRRAIATYEESDRNCVHLELNFEAHRQIKYKTGDHISIWPMNPAKEVSSLIQVLGLESRKDTRIHVLSRDENHELDVPSPTTPCMLFQHYLEICAPVPREKVLFLADFAPTERAKAELRGLAQTKDTYMRFLDHNYITLSRLLKYVTEIDSSVTWAGLPLSFVIDILPAMKPRTYSISSSPTVSPRQVSITVSTNQTRLAAKPYIAIPGLASAFLSSTPLFGSATGENKDRNSTAPSRIYAQVRTSAFRLPVSLSLPIVMVAAGTGIAPFRAFLQDRAYLASIGREVGPMLLFFGCQGNSDFLYRDLIQELQSGPLASKLQVFTAFSRTKGEKKQYVGDQLAARSPEVAHLLTEEDGAFYICGAASMAKAVKDILKKQMKVSEGWSGAEADDWVQQKKKANRWFEDTWS
ncbi:hypothetical protein F5Y09DRAFT_351210 [Xylaria sp. FL1042]|nr:hypothetical protein F5Y09DRAFT_351210 [Xylaria sp. FL1042]